MARQAKPSPDRSGQGIAVGRHAVIGENPSRKYVALRSVWNWNHQPELKTIRLMSEGRLLRAPGWSADDIGWPDARRPLRRYRRPGTR